MAEAEEKEREPGETIDSRTIRRKNEVAMIAKHWGRGPRGTWGTRRNACAAGRPAAGRQFQI